MQITQLRFIVVQWNNSDQKLRDHTRTSYLFFLHETRIKAGIRGIRSLKVPRIVPRMLGCVKGLTPQSTYNIITMTRVRKANVTPVAIRTRELVWKKQVCSIESMKVNMLRYPTKLEFKIIAHEENVRTSMRRMWSANCMRTRVVQAHRGGCSFRLDTGPKCMKCKISG